MRSIYDRLGGQRVVASVVDDLYDRLTRDPRVLHHFDPQRLPSLKEAQCRWLTAALGGPVDGPVSDLATAHRDLEITDDQIDAVIGHLDAAIGTTGIDPDLRRQVMTVVSRLWYARAF